jgi:hypothetical protein
MAIAWLLDLEGVVAKGRPESQKANLDAAIA